MKTVLLHIHNDAGQESRLQAALDLARAFSAHIHCVQATPFEYIVIGDPMGGAHVPPQLVAEVRAGELAEQARIEDRLKVEGLPFDWRQIDGDIGDVLVSEASLADVIVMSQPPVSRDDRRPVYQKIGEVAVAARPPVLAMPVRASAFDPAGSAIIAWNGSFEAANALHFALPLLCRASRVRLVEVCRDTSRFPSTRAAEYLSRHGVHAEIQQVEADPDGTAATLARIAREAGAAYLVMGAYGHSRLREMVFGGVTRDLVAHSEVPLVLAH